MLSPLPVVSFGCLLSVMWPLQRLWQTHRHTALHSTCLWVFITAGAWILLSGCGLVESDTLQKWTGLLRQFATTLLLTPIVAVLGARWP